MKIDHDVPRHTYVNVMELLVSEEVEKQLKTMQPRMLKYLKRVEVETYALNRLPSLYASSEKGRQLQYEKAKRELYNQIKSAVRQAFAAVQVDPIRASEPLHNQQDDAASVALSTLRDLLKQPDLNWDGVINRLRSLLGRRGDQPPTAPAQEPSHRTRYRNDAPDMTATVNPDHGHHWRPGTYGSEVSWKKTHNPGSAQASSEFDWKDNRYSK